MQVIVLGGGVIGSASAVALQSQGAHVTLVDAAAHQEERASYGNATMIANELVEPLASWAVARQSPRRLFGFGGPLDFVWKDVALWAPWAVRYLAACSPSRRKAGTEALTALCNGALPAWRRLVDQLGRRDLLDEAAHWAVWESAASLQAGRASVMAAQAGPVTVRPLASQEVIAIQRQASAGIAGGVAFEGSARITDPGAAVLALHRRLMSAGGLVIPGAAQQVVVEADRVQVTLAGAQLSADYVLVAAGARSASLMRGSGLKAPLVAERGYHLQYAEHRMDPGLPALIFEDRFICVVRAGADVRVTGFTEVGHPDSAPDPRKWNALARHVEELRLPVEGEPLRWMGARPTLPDFLPAIGRKGRLLYAFGHQHIGLTLAAITAESIAQLLGGADPSWLKPFRLERFG